MFISDLRVMCVSRATPGGVGRRHGARRVHRPNRLRFRASPTPLAGAVTRVPSLRSRPLSRRGHAQTPVGRNGRGDWIRTSDLPGSSRSLESTALWQKWSGRLDSNQRPLRPERSALPSCATPRHDPASRRRESTLSAGSDKAAGRLGVAPLPETMLRRPGAGSGWLRGTQRVRGAARLPCACRRSPCRPRKRSLRHAALGRSFPW